MIRILRFLVVLDLAAADSGEAASDDEVVSIARELMSQDAAVYEALSE